MLDPSRSLSDQIARHCDRVARAKEASKLRAIHFLSSAHAQLPRHDDRNSSRIRNYQVVIPSYVRSVHPCLHCSLCTSYSANKLPRLQKAKKNKSWMCAQASPGAMFNLLIPDRHGSNRTFSLMCPKDKRAHSIIPCMMSPIDDRPKRQLI